jgi:hypothetical protein
MKIKNKLKPFRGSNGRWGVDGCGLLYHSGFSKRTAQRIADLENSDEPPKDWEHTKTILDKEGFDTTYSE